MAADRERPAANERPKCGHVPECFEQTADGSWTCSECERVEQLLPGCRGDRLAALDRRGDELIEFNRLTDGARKWVKEHGTDELVEELRAARRRKRKMHIGTQNTLILLAHIDRLEAEIAREALVLS